MTQPNQFGITATMNVSQVLAGARQVNQALNQTTQQARQLNTSLASVSKIGPSNLIFLGLDLQQLAQTMAILSGAFIATAGASAKFALDFGAALRDINSLLKLNEEGLANLEKQLINIARDPTIIQTPIELAKGFQFLASSGFTGARGLEVLRAAAIGAGAGNANLSTVTRGLAGILNALPRGTITAQEAVDLLFSTVDKGIITFEELTEGIGETIGAVGATEVSFAETSAAIATMTRSGIPAAETMTSLNRVLSAFIAPTAESKKTAADLGIAFNLTSLRSKGLTQSLVEVTQAAQGDTEALSRLFGDQRALRGILSLTRNSGADFAEVLKEMEDASLGVGSAAEALAERLKAPRVQLQVLIKDLQLAGITIGEDFIPIISLVVEAVKNVAQSFAGLPAPVRFAIEGFGAIFISATALVFGLSRLFTGLGAVSNFMLQMSRVTLRGLAAAFTGATGATALNTTATLVNSAAVGASAAAQTPIATILIANKSGYVTSTVAVQANTAALTGNAAAATAAGAATAGLAAALTKVIAVATVVGGLFLLLKGMQDLSTEALTANKSVSQLLDTIDNLNRPLNIEVGGLNLIGRSADQRRIEEHLVKPSLQLESAINQARNAQEEFVNEAKENLPKVRAELTEALQAATDPRVIQSLRDGLRQIQEEGTQAISQTGFSTLSAGQKFLLREHLDALDTVIRFSREKGLTEVAERTEATKKQIIEDIGGLDVRVPITVDSIIQPFVQELQKQIDKAKEVAEAELASFRRELEDVEKAQKATRRAQLELGLVMAQSQRDVRQASDAVAELREQLEAAQDAISRFSSPTLVGMRALDDQIFQSSQGIALLNLEILNIEKQFAPAIGQAREELLKLRLRLEEVRKTAATISLEDIVSFQLRELREGVPVLRSIIDRIRGQNKQGADQRSAEQQALDAAEKRLEQLNLQKEIAQSQLQQQLELAQLEERRLELTRQTTFEPQLRELQKMAETEAEITFEQAIEGLQQAQIEETTLNRLLVDANALLRHREDIQDNLQRQQEDLQRQSILQQLEEERLNDKVRDREKLLKQELDSLIAQKEVTAALADISEQAIARQTEQIRIQEQAVLRLEETLARVFPTATSVPGAFGGRFEPKEAPTQPETFWSKLLDVLGQIGRAFADGGAAGLPIGGTGGPGGGMSWPVRGSITQSWQKPPGHNGLDIANSAGTGVAASAGGNVSFTGYAPDYGNWVEIDHGNGLATRYAHLAQILVGLGDAIRRGDFLGLMGSTGRSTGPHLHWEVLRRGTKIDPSRFLPGFSKGGPVGVGMPIGTPIVAQLHAGEFVISQPKVAQLRAAGGPTGSSVPVQSGNTVNWNVIINNNGGTQDTAGRLFRESKRQRLAGAW